MKGSPAGPRRVFEVTSLPTYEYHCPSCKATYELRQGFDAETTHTCEECGNGTAKRVLHAPPVVFKGSGWYVTDSRSKSSAVTDSAADSTDSGPPAEPAAAPAPATSTEAPAAP
jgi:putative FmdB family regulatory protein